MRSKGYGFVSFATREQAATAIASMNGKYLGKRPIRTNWASRNP
jgi:nucleolysin TIA-1/TIAR